MYTRLPSIPGIFQGFRKHLLARITYVIMRLDDILVKGKNDEEHLWNLDEILKQLLNAGMRMKKCIYFHGTSGSAL